MDEQLLVVIQRCLVKGNKTSGNSRQLQISGYQNYKRGITRQSPKRAFMVEHICWPKRTGGTVLSSYVKVYEGTWLGWSVTHSSLALLS